MESTLWRWEFGAWGRPIARAPLLPPSVCTRLLDGQLPSKISHPAGLSGGLPGMHGKGNEVLVDAVDSTARPPELADSFPPG
jgi:hypothetical protein